MDTLAVWAMMESPAENHTHPTTRITRGVCREAAARDDHEFYAVGAIYQLDVVRWLA